MEEGMRVYTPAQNNATRMTSAEGKMLMGHARVQTSEAVERG